jgi:carbon storage regulator
MLIISRKVHQVIHIGDDVTITVVAVRGKQVRVGIKAPPDVPIRRHELEPLPHIQDESVDRGRAGAFPSLPENAAAISSVQISGPSTCHQ